MSIEKKCDNCYLGKNCELRDECITSCYHFMPKEELVRQECINDFKTIIDGIHIVEDFDIDRPMEKFMFNRGINEYKKKLNERLEKYSKEK